MYADDRSESGRLKLIVLRVKTVGAGRLKKKPVAAELYRSSEVVSREQEDKGQAVQGWSSWEMG